MQEQNTSQLIHEIPVVNEQIFNYEPISPEDLEVRISDALANCEFVSTPEVTGAVEGFYKDHYGLAAQVSEALKDGEELEKLEFPEGTPHEMIVRAEKLQRVANEHRTKPTRESTINLIQVAAECAGSLFAESAVGITTIGEQEFEVRELLGNQVLEFAYNNGMQWMFDGNNSYEARKTQVPDFADSTIKYKRDLDLKQIEDLRVPEIINSDENGNVIFRESSSVEDGVIRSTKLTEYFTKGKITKAQIEFWNDVRRASHLEYHGTPYAGELLTEGLKSRNQQIRDRNFYATSNAVATDGRHHSNAIKFSEFMPSGEYTSRGNPREATADLSYTPATVGVPIADIIKSAPYARNAEFAIVDVDDEHAVEMLERTNTGPILSSIGGGSTEHVGIPPGGSIQRVFFARKEEGGEISPDEYTIGLVGVDADGVAASTSRVLFTYYDSDWMVPLGYQYPTVIKLDGGRSEADQVAVKQAQDAIDTDPHYHGKYAVPLRRGVFSFYPEESDHKEYPYANGPTYNQVARFVGKTAVA